MGEPITPVRVEVTVADQRYVVLCELARPIHRRALTPAGGRSERDSRRGVETFQLLLAR